MNKAQALQKFYEGFGLTAYPQGSVPDKADFPYLTYENIIGNNGQETNPTVNLWFRSNSEAVPNAKADAISKVIGQGVSLKCDDGAIYVYFNEAWNVVADVDDNTIKRRTTNLLVVFNTY